MGGWKRTILVIGVLALVAGASFAAAYWLPVGEAAATFFGVPGVLALIGVLVQLWRDSTAHERSLELVARQQDFTLGTATHMADIAYDKHVDFCEAYIAKTSTGLQQLYEKGPSDVALPIAYDLASIRVSYRAWLTEEIEDSLIPFEQALREIGANKEYLKDLPIGTERSRVVNAMYEAFKLATGMSEAVSVEEREKTSAHVIEALRDVLGIRELTALRRRATAVALSRLVESP